MITANQVARSRITIEELKDYHLGAKHIEEWGNAVGDPIDQHQYALDLAANLDEKGLRFVEILGKCAGIIGGHRKK